MGLEDLFQAIADDRGVGELKEYLAAGGTPNDRDPVSGWCLLQAACEHQNHVVIRALLQHGAEINARDAINSRQTPLHHAVDIDLDSAWQQTHDLKQPVNFETTRLLLEAGADPDLPDDRGRTPRSMAAGYGPEIAEKFNRLCLDARRAGRLGGG